MPVAVREVTTARELRTFVRLPWKLYRGDPNWVPPLISDLEATLVGRDNAQFQAGPHALGLAWRSPDAAPGGRGEPVGRLVVGINQRLNQAKAASGGYLSLFESIEDDEVARTLFDWAVAWLKERGATSVKGPVSPTNGDDYRGLLVHGFDRPPVLMESYNPPYYAGFFDRYGFTKDIDLYAYLYRADRIPTRYGRVATYAMRRYGFRADPFDLGNLDRDIRDLKRVLDLALPEEWVDLAPPTLEEIRGMVRKLRPLADPELCSIARTDASEPIGFVVGLPDYNQVLARLDGRLFPFGWLRFLYYRRKIDGVRLFICFVVPEWRKKGVTGVMFWHVLTAGLRRGYEWGEGSTIGETNLPMRRDAERAGGDHYKTYRIYRMKI